MNIYEYCASEQAGDDIIIIAKCSNVDTLKKSKFLVYIPFPPNYFFLYLFPKDLDSRLKV